MLKCRNCLILLHQKPGFELVIISIVKALLVVFYIKQDNLVDLSIQLLLGSCRTKRTDWING